MLRTILVRPPGGATGRVRRQYASSILRHQQEDAFKDKFRGPLRGRDPFSCQVQLCLPHKDKRGNEVPSGGVQGGDRVHGRESIISSIDSRGYIWLGDGGCLGVVNGKNLMRNAWRKTGYDWFFEEGVGDVGDNGDEVIDDDNDGGDGANFDEVCDVADMLDDILGLGEDSDNESDDNEMLWGEA